MVAGFAINIVVVEIIGLADIASLDDRFEVNIGTDVYPAFTLSAFGSRSITWHLGNMENEEPKHPSEPTKYEIVGSSSPQTIPSWCGLLDQERRNAQRYDSQAFLNKRLARILLDRDIALGWLLPSVPTAITVSTRAVSEFFQRCSALVSCASG